MRFPTAHLVLISAVLTVASGCKRKEITVSVVPKDPSASAPSTPGPASSPTTAGASNDVNAPNAAPPMTLPKLGWTLPPGWVEAPAGTMSVANFKLQAEGGQATVSVTPLGDLSGHEPEVVQMWREQVGAPPLQPGEAEAALKPIDVAGGSGRLFEITGTRDQKASHIVTAMFNRADGTWFFKLAGDDAAVTAQKPAFLEFLKSIRFEDAVPAKAELTKATPEPGAAKPDSDSTPGTAAAKPAGPPPATSSAPAASATPPTLDPPTGWTPLPAGQMQIAKYSLPAQGDAKAEVAVSMFSSDTGGPVANIARWRRQLNLPEASEQEIAALGQPLDPSLPGALVADLKNEQRRMIGAIVPRPSGWWFYKLTGDDAAVSAAREAFLNFAKSQPKS